MTTPPNPSYIAGRAHARAHPRKAARQLRKVEATLDLGLHEGTREGGRLRALAAGLRAGLAGVHCEDCGARLEDETSQRRGVGPDCWSKRQAAARG